MRRDQEIIDFWFSSEARSHWFKSTDRFDGQVREKFETTAIALAAGMQAGRGSYADWEDRPDSALALIIALDQFPRNMYRGTPAAFAWDPLALTAARRAVERGHDLKLGQDRRPFAYMPFMHAEDLEAQERCVSLCDSRLKDDTIKHAITHRDIIARFGRFPHRNDVLGRVTTPEEQDYLDNGGFNPT